MRTYAAYIDESGDPNFTDGATKTLFVGAVVFPIDNMEELETQLLAIKDKHKIAELKSSSIRSYHHRVAICSDLVTLDVKFITLYVDKAKLKGTWYQRRETFYKYVQKVLNTEVYRLFGNVQTKIDKYGSAEYQRSLRDYLHVSLQRELFNPDIQVSSAKVEKFIQIADFLSGTIRKLLEGDFDNCDELEAVLSRQWICRRNLPDTGKYVGPVSDTEFDHCLEEAKRFLEKGMFEENDPKILTLDYLYHTALVYPDRWVYTQEIQQWLADHGISIGEEQFRNEITAALRDHGVVVVGTRKGLKIPTCSEDIREYADFSVKLTLPVLKRLKKALQFLDSRIEGGAFSGLLSPEAQAVLDRVEA